MIKVEYNSLVDFRHAQEHAPELFAVAEALTTAIVIGPLGIDDSEHVINQSKTGNNSWSLVCASGRSFHFRFRRDYSAIDVFDTWQHSGHRPIVTFTEPQAARSWAWEQFSNVHQEAWAA